MENFNEEFNLDESMWDDESLNGSGTLEYDDDDESYSEYDDDDGETYLEYDDDDETIGDYDDDEASPELLGGILAGKAISGISRLLGKRSSRRARSYGRGRRPSIYRGGVARIPSTSNLSGMLRTPRGKNLPISLPKNLATKRDVFALRKSISANRSLVNGNTKRVGEVIGDLKKAKAHITSVDNKHIAASKAQNNLIGGINKKLVKVDKAVDKTKEQMQMNQLLSMFMTPKLEEFTVESITGFNASATDDDKKLDGATIKVSKTKNTDNNLGLMMAMSGGLGGDSGMNPMMMYFLMSK